MDFSRFFNLSSSADVEASGTPGAGPGPEDTALADAKQVAISLIADCQMEEKLRLGGQIRATYDITDFWYLRSDIYAVIARKHGEGIARVRLASVEKALGSYAPKRR